MIFQSADAMLRWIYVASGDDIRGAIARNFKFRNGAHVTRVLGGIKWRDGKENSPLRIFVGCSCEATPLEDKETGVGGN